MKKKLYVVLIVIASAFLLNYGLWFAHTRVINDSIRKLRHSLANYGIKLNYKDMHYKTFAFWNVKVNFTDLRISGGWRAARHKFIFDRIHMVSNPLDKSFFFQVNGNMKVMEDSLIGKNKRTIVFESPPQAKLTLKKSLKNSWDAGSIFDVINNIELNTERMYIHDEKDQLLSTIKQVSFQYDSHKDGHISINGKRLGRKLNSDYISRTDLEAKAIDHAKAFGNMDENFSLKIKKEIADKNDTALKEKFGNAYEQNQLEDTYDHLIELLEFNHKNDLYTLLWKGSARLYDNKPLPDIKLDLYMKPFDSFMNQIFKDMDLYLTIANSLRDQGKLPTLTAEKRDELNNYIIKQTDSLDDGTRKLNFDFNSNGTMSIGKVPLPIFASQIFEMLKDYIPLFSGTNPNPELNLPTGSGPATENYQQQKQ